MGTTDNLTDGTLIELVTVQEVLRRGNPPCWTTDGPEDGPCNAEGYGDFYVHETFSKSETMAWVKVFEGAEAPAKAAILTTDKAARKAMPIARGVIDYFPRALAAVANVSFVANEQHNPGEPMHWDKSKSTDHADCIARHLIERGSKDDDGLRHSAKLAWRALALLETELEAEATEKK